MFFNNLSHTGFDEEDHTIDDDGEQSISLHCSMALSFLAQIFKDDLLDFTFLFVQQILEYGQQNGDPWMNRYIALIAFNSTIEGPSQDKLYVNYTQVIQWIYENARH